MARLGAVIRGRDVRCLSSTFVFVVFLTSIALLTLHPVQYPTKTSMIDLPIEEVVRVQSIPELEMDTSTTTTTKSTKKSWRKKAEKSNKNKAIKDLWIKDELPKNVSSQSPKPPNEKGVETQESTATMSKAATKQTHTEVPHETPASPSEHPSNQVKSEPSRSLKPSFTLSKLAKTPLKKIDSPFIDPLSLLTQDVEKKIITWYKPDSPRQTNQKKKVFQDCPDSACRVVYPLPPDLLADAVVFNDVDPEDVPPERTHKDQVFVYHTMEPPSFPEPGVWPKTWNSVFNWTWTYRRDSDIWQPFGSLTKSRKIRPLDFFYKVSTIKERPVAWMPRSCTPETSSKRSEFVKELSRHITVTEFGGCSNNKTCSKGNKACSDHLSRKYFFLLALEEDICKDHVTAAFYRAWQDDTHVVPVVRGGADYAAYFPEGTFIDADWFDTPKELASFLTKLMTKKKLYSQLLWRKAHWVRSHHSDEATYCQFCYRLHHLESNRKQYPDMRLWFEENACKFPRPLN